MEREIESVISQNLIELRKNRNLKQSELSDAIGYSDKTISRWENGTSVPDIGTLVRLAEFYDIGIEDLIHPNALGKAILEEKKATQEVLANKVAIPTLSTFSIWLIAALIYIGFMFVSNYSFWQVFIWAIPVSAFFMYRNTRKVYNIKWVNILFLTIMNLGFVLSVYLQMIDYNFWPIFLLALPLEAMAVSSVIFGKTDKKTTKKKRHIFKKNESPKE